MDLLRLSCIHFSWPNSPPLFNGLNFILAQNDRVGIYGSNGAGKSTLFFLSMGFIRPQSGQIWALGHPRIKEKDFREVRTQIGFCFQDADNQLFAPTVLEDVAFGPLNLGKNAQEAQIIATDTLKRLNLAGYEKKIIWNLSAGEKRLVSIATVLAMDPKALLLDEPTNGLDENSQKHLEKILLSSTLSWAIISHDKFFLKHTCSKIYKLASGLLIET